MQRLEMQELTPRQQEILEFIQNEITKTRRAPSLVEIGKHFSIASPNGVRAHVLSLQRKGWIERDPVKARSIRPLAIPGRFATIIATLKKKIWAHKRYFVHLPIAMAFRTRKGYHFFEGPFAAELEQQVRKACANHDWEILSLEIRSDGFAIQLVASPDHSVERIARNLKNATLPLAVRHPIHFHGKGIWAPGFAASMNPEMIEELSEHHRQSLSTGPEEDDQT